MGAIKLMNQVLYNSYYSQKKNPLKESEFIFEACPYLLNALIAATLYPGILCNYFWNWGKEQVQFIQGSIERNCRVT